MKPKRFVIVVVFVLIACILLISFTKRSSVRRALSVYSSSRSWPYVIAEKALATTTSQPIAPLMPTDAKRVSSAPHERKNPSPIRAATARPSPIRKPKKESSTPRPPPPRPKSTPVAEKKANSPKDICPKMPPNLSGPLMINEDVTLELDRIEKESVADGMVVGGLFTPRSCKARNSIAIIVPFRNREEQLKVFLHYMVPILRRQLLQFRIYVVEQSDALIFNRGAVMNVGYVEARKDMDYDCYAWHDVDLIIENDKNIYFCPSDETKAIHLTTVIHKSGHTWRPYSTCFGGAAIMTKNQVQKTNGYSNVYWGWGGEDDDLFFRLRSKGMGFVRPVESIGSYVMLLKHHKSAALNPRRFDQLKTRERRFSSDGINSVKYTVVDRKLYSLYTRIRMKLEKEQWGG
ncbi:beta-1,4-galactosyltransferase 1-like [Oscarella lobularis]|uniref:beta-1,4-galactosyltransferase 1-like n=1 Tax=Oscarella lobularis TaxID=121494 RepID=UPI0033144705